MHFKGPEEAIDGALIGSVKKIYARVDAFTAAERRTPSPANSFQLMIASVMTTMDMWRRASVGCRAPRVVGRTSSGHPAIIHQDGTGDPDIDQNLVGSSRCVATRNGLR